MKTSEKERERGRLKAAKALRENPERVHAYQRAYGQSAKGKLKSYRRNANSRGIEFALTLDDILNLWQKPCWYCGSAIETVGIDRIDNTKGYVKGNITTCCAICNHMKRNWTAYDFVAQCVRVAKMHTLGTRQNKGRTSDTIPSKNTRA